MLIIASIVLAVCYHQALAVPVSDLLKLPDTNALRPSPIGNVKIGDPLPDFNVKLQATLSGLDSVYRKTSPDFLDKKLKEVNLPNPMTNQKRQTVNSILSLTPVKKPERFAVFGDTPYEINNEYSTAKLMYQGDMIVEDEQIERILKDAKSRQKRQAYTLFHPRTLWDSTISYEMGNVSTTARSAIMKAISFWQNHTCIRFVERPNVAARLHFFSGAGCFSGVGKPLDGGMQGVSIGYGCEHVPIAAHEIAHALGFFHTQNRNDRDAQIIVNYDNIMPLYYPNYLKLSEFENDNYGLPYDYGSGMHYDQYGFAKNGTVPTLVPTDARYQNSMGQNLPSFVDIHMMNTMYNCHSKCSQSKCVNNGFPNPNNCNTCICPSGYGGPLCGSPVPNYDPFKSPASEHRTINTANALTSTSLSLSGLTPAIDSDYKVQNLWIKAPAGKKVEVTIKGFTGMSLCAISCSYGGIEVKVNSDNRLSGIRNCCADDVGKVYVSDGNLMALSLYSRYGFYGVDIQHRSV